MAEDYTYTTVTDWRKRAHELAGNVLDLESAAKKQRQQVQELERALAQADSNMVALAARNAELAARLDAVPVAAIRYMLDPFANGGTSWAESEAHMNTLTAWVQAQTQPAQPDDTDAPLTLAAIDEDGDE